MKKLLLLLVIAIAAVAWFGCEPHDRQEALDHSQAAVNEAGKALTVVWNSVAKKAKNIDWHSSDAQIDDAKKGLEEAETKIKDGTSKDATAVKAQIDRLDAAKRLKDAQESVDKAKEGANTAAKANDELQQKWDEAKKAYDAAAKRAQDAWDAATK